MQERRARQFTSGKSKWLWLIKDKTWTNLKPDVAKAIVKSPENSDLIGNWGLHSVKFCVVSVANGVPTVQNVKKKHIQNISHHGQLSHR